MQDTIPRTLTAAQAARCRQCPLCRAGPGMPCQAKPAGDHLARYLDAYTAGELSREYIAAVLGELVVIARSRDRPGRCVMTGPEHYQEAETQAESAARAIDDRMSDDARVSLGLAQVHATLALAAATGVNSANKDERQEWQYVAGVKL